MITYPNGVILDVDMGLGRERGYDQLVTRLPFFSSRDEWLEWYEARGQRAECHPHRRYWMYKRCSTCYNQT